MTTTEYRMNKLGVWCEETSHKPWALLIHPYVEGDNDIKSHICYTYLKFFTSDLHPKYNHSSLLVWDETDNLYVQYYPTTESIWLYEFSDLNQVMKFYGDGTIAVLFYPDESTLQEFDCRIDNVHCMTNLGFVKYALGLWRYEPVCSEWIQYVLGHWYAHDETGRPLFHRDKTETPSTLAMLLADMYNADTYIWCDGNAQYFDIRDDDLW